MLTTSGRVVGPMITKLITAMVVLVLAAPAGPLAEAQPPLRVYRVGYLGVRALPVEGHLWQRFVGVFRDAGLIEGQHVVFERRFAEEHVDRYPALAAELATLYVSTLL